MSSCGYTCGCVCACVYSACACVFHATLQCVISQYVHVSVQAGTEAAGSFGAKTVNCGVKRILAPELLATLSLTGLFKIKYPLFKNCNSFFYDIWYKCNSVNLFY